MQLIVYYEVPLGHREEVKGSLMILFYLLYLDLISSSQLTIFIYSFDILGY
jgi:hypothetical protein